MIYLFHGSDTGRVRAKAFQWVAAARAKAPDAGYIRLTADALSPEALGEALGSQGLFFAKTLVLLDDPFTEPDAGDLVMDMLNDLSESQNPIAVLAPKLTAARLKKLEAKAEKVFEVSTAEKKQARGFNTALVNALAAKDGQALWKELVKAERAGDAPEMLHGLLHWKARDMMQKGNRAWGRDGARTLSRELIELLSDARSGDLPLGPALERFALSLR